MQILGPRLLVEMEPEDSVFKGYSIIKPDTVHDTAIGFGKVLDVGTGTPTRSGRAPVEGVKVGDWVAFVKFLKETQSNRAVAHTIGEDNLLIELKDVVVVIPA